MAFKAILDKAEVEKLPDPVKAEYKEGQNGKFFLQVDPVATSEGTFGLENVSGLKDALSKERGNRESLEKQLTNFKDLDPAAAREALAKVAEMANWTPEQKVREQLAATKRELETKFEQERSGLKSRSDTLFTQLQKAMITEAATRAIASAKGSVPLLLPVVERLTRLKNDGANFTVEVHRGDNGATRISPKTGATSNMTIDELIAELKSSDEFARAFDSSGATGSGATGGGNAGGDNGTGGSNGGAGGGTRDQNGTLLIDARDMRAVSQNITNIAEGKARVVFPGQNP